MKRVLGIAAAAIFALTTILLMTLSPLSDGLFDPGNDTFADIVVLIGFSAAVSVGVCVAVMVIVAACMLAHRLGYDQMSGLLLLIPVINIVVFFYWAFCESPNERQLRMLKRKSHRKLSRDDFDL